MKKLTLIAAIFVTGALVQAQNQKAVGTALDAGDQIADQMSKDGALSKETAKRNARLGYPTGGQLTEPEFTKTFAGIQLVLKANDCNHTVPSNAAELARQACVKSTHNDVLPAKETVDTGGFHMDCSYISIEKGNGEFSISPRNGDEKYPKVSYYVGEKGKLKGFLADNKYYDGEECERVAKEAAKGQKDLCKLADATIASVSAKTISNDFSAKIRPMQTAINCMKYYPDSRLNSLRGSSTCETMDRGLYEQSVLQGQQLRNQLEQVYGSGSGFGAGFGVLPKSKVPGGPFAIPGNGTR